MWKLIEEFDKTEMQFVLVYADGAMRLYLWNHVRKCWEHPFPYGAIVERSHECSNPTHFTELPDCPE